MEIWTIDVLLIWLNNSTSFDGFESECNNTRKWYIVIAWYVEQFFSILLPYEIYIYDAHGSICICKFFLYIDWSV